ncbi:alkaline ceramidase 2-like [Patiria miniata]|uniref:Alkaline ceramidase n=1 Tax=Patiria miniata TaxID=46514 RepID=A0A914B192_PATMI|nr:alkaline ceramidase 2-like [Patiria miniata]
MFKELSRGSADVDWCEDNYSISPFIAEFYNTISNAFFFVFPPMMWALFKDYAHRINPSINLMWVLMMLVGACSAYFHCTLSLVGQLLDEVSILWAFSLGAGLWFPRRYYPRILKGDRRRFRIFVFILMLCGTMLAFIKPWLNSFLLLAFVVPGFWTAYLELRRVQSHQRVTTLFRTASVLWIVSISCWVADRTLCDFWLFVSFPYLHSFWHVFILLACYYSVVLYAYFDATSEWAEMGPVLRYWPNDSHTKFGVPYVALKSNPYSDENMNKIF